MLLKKGWLTMISFYMIALIVAQCAILTPRELDIRRTHSMDPKKRPFCNAFTGCGKKRSSANDLIAPPRFQENIPSGQDEIADENSLTDLIDLNSEPAVDELMRQIMSQAKMWEALQEASREIYTQRHHPDTSSPRDPMSFSTQ